MGSYTIILNCTRQGSHYAPLSRVKSHNRKMTEIVENELRAHLMSLLSYIQGTPYFLNKLQ